MTNEIPVRADRRTLLAGAGMLLCVAGGPGPATAGEDTAMTARGAIQKVLSDSAEAWSRGDLDAFMQSYENSPAVRYVKGDQVVAGYAEIRAMYAERFGGAAGMGKLTMEIVVFQMLGAEHALVIGRYHLTALPGPNPEARGIFSLVFHRGAGGWGILADHSS